MDDIGGVFHRVETETYGWEDLRKQFLNHEQYAYLARRKAEEAGCKRNRRSWQFADGATRMLNKDSLFLKVLNAIKDIPDDDFNPV